MEAQMRIGPLFVLTSIVLIGCQTSYRGNESSPLYVVPAGSHVLLNQNLPIAADRLGVYVQFGRAVSNAAEVQQIYPFCKFELVHLSDAARTVAPDDMTVTKTVQQEIQ